MELLVEGAAFALGIVVAAAASRVVLWAVLATTFGRRA